MYNFVVCLGWCLFQTWAVNGNGFSAWRECCETILSFSFSISKGMKPCDIVVDIDEVPEEEVRAVLNKVN